MRIAPGRGGRVVVVTTAALALGCSLSAAAEPAHAKRPPPPPPLQASPRPPPPKPPSPLAVGRLGLADRTDPAPQCRTGCATRRLRCVQTGEAEACASAWARCVTACQR